MLPILLIAFVSLGVGKIALDTFEQHELSEDDEAEQDMCEIRRQRRRKAEEHMRNQPKPKYLVIKGDNLYVSPNQATETGDATGAIEREKLLRKHEKQKRMKAQLQRDWQKTVSVLTCKAVLNMDEPSADTESTHEYNQLIDTDIEEPKSNEQNDNVVLEETDDKNPKLISHDKNNRNALKEENEECIVCFEKNPDTVIVNCGHGGICYDCAMDIYCLSEECPICRSEFDCIVQISPQKIYLDKESEEMVVAVIGPSKKRNKLMRLIAYNSETQ